MTSPEFLSFFKRLCIFIQQNHELRCMEIAEKRYPHAADFSPQTLDRFGESEYFEFGLCCIW